MLTGTRHGVSDPPDVADLRQPSLRGLGLQTIDSSSPFSSFRIEAVSLDCGQGRRQAVSDEDAGAAHG